MGRIWLGAALVVAGVAAFIVASSTAPEYVYNCGRPERCPYNTPLTLAHGHLARAPYDVLLIGAWALVIVGALLVVTGLVAYLRAPR